MAKSIEAKHYNKYFTDKMRGGAFVYKADKSRSILYANKNLLHFFECGSFEEFTELTGGTFDGMISSPEPEIINREISMCLTDSSDGSGYVFFNIKTKNGNVRRVVNHWTLVRDDNEGDIFYAYIFLHKLEHTGTDYDAVTGLLGKSKFDRYANDLNRKYYKEDKDPYAIVFVNLVNFKLLNIEHGTKEGDECLKAIAGALTKSFESAFVARLSNDHFAIFTKYENIYEHAATALQLFYFDYGFKSNVICKFGIYRFNLAPDFDVEAALSLAKTACDYIKRSKKDDIAEYTTELASRIKTARYVADKIDDAIKNEWLRVYFQPVIRTLTGKLCSMESLVRWIDPDLGFLPPDKFIGALEDERCIHKLDSFVVDKVCACIRKRMDEGKPMVPVSVNFSRLDFVLCDMLNVVETAVETYNIPRNYIHIEITESMIASDEGLMRKVIDEFAEAGYEIWMDDFGSGYSSLTVLKGYNFDMLKMDMSFLYPFTEKSKSILRSVVSMAKDIGMKTLAEGVETQDQLEFLKEIGCGRIQGYYYGKPEPVEDVFKHLEEKGIPVEEVEWTDFYNIAGFNAKSTEAPLEIIEDDGENFTTLFMNKSYMNQIFDEDITLDEFDKKVYHTASPLLPKFREFAKIAEESEKPETFYYTAGGKYMCLTVQSLASHGGHHIIKGTISNISTNKNVRERKRLDKMLKEMNLLFESVQAVNLKENTIVSLLGRYKYIDHDIMDYQDLQKSIRFFSTMVVLPEERERCAAFLRSEDLAKRVEATGMGYIADVFTLKQEDGNYRRCETYIMMIPGTGGNEFLFCVKPCIEASVSK